MINLDSYTYSHEILGNDLSDPRRNLFYCVRLLRSQLSCFLTTLMKYAGILYIQQVLHSGDDSIRSKTE